MATGARTVKPLRLHRGKALATIIDCLADTLCDFMIERLPMLFSLQDRLRSHRTSPTYQVFGRATFLLAALMASSAQADLVLGPFVNGGNLDGQSLGSTATYTDGVTGTVGTLTTRTLIDTDGTFVAGTVVNTNSNGLAINSGSGVTNFDTSGRFDKQEGWGFDWDIDTSLTSLDFSAFTTADGESFTIQSDDWIGLAFSPTIAAVTFDNLTGGFTLSNKDSSDLFDLQDLSGGATIAITAGTDILITYSNTATQNDIAATGSASLQNLQFAVTAVPEPSSLAVVVFSMLGLGIYRRRKPAPQKRK